MGISMDRDQVGSTRLSLLDASMPKSTQLLKKTGGSGRRLDLSIGPLESTQELLDWLATGRFERLMEGTPPVVTTAWTGNGERKQDDQSLVGARRKIARIYSIIRGERRVN